MWVLGIRSQVLMLVRVVLHQLNWPYLPTPCKTVLICGNPCRLCSSHLSPYMSTHIKTICPSLCCCSSLLLSRTFFATYCKYSSKSHCILKACCFESTGQKKEKKKTLNILHSCWIRIKKLRKNSFGRCPHTLEGEFIAAICIAQTESHSHRTLTSTIWRQVRAAKRCQVTLFPEIFLVLPCLPLVFNQPSRK